MRNLIVITALLINAFSQVMAQDGSRGLTYTNYYYGFSFEYPAYEQPIEIVDRGPDEHNNREFYLSIGWIKPMITLSVLTNFENLGVEEYALASLERWGYSQEDIEVEEISVAGNNAVKLSFVQIAGAGCPTVHVAIAHEGKILWLNSECHAENLPVVLSSFKFY